MMRIRAPALFHLTIQKKMRKCSIAISGAAQMFMQSEEKRVGIFRNAQGGIIILYALKKQIQRLFVMKTAHIRRGGL